MLPFKIHCTFIVRTVSFLNPQPFITLTLCIWGGTHVHVRNNWYRGFSLPCVSGMAPVPLPLSHLSGLLFCISSSHLPGESQSLDLMRHFLHKHQRMPRACFWTKSPCAQKSKRRQKLLTNWSLRTCTRQSSPFQRPFSSQRR